MLFSEWPCRLQAPPRARILLSRGRALESAAAGRVFKARNALIAAIEWLYLALRVFLWVAAEYGAGE